MHKNTWRINSRSSRSKCRFRLKITQRKTESMAHEKVVGFLCMLLITLTFTDLSFAHEFYCAIKKEAWNVDYISGQAFVLFGGVHAWIAIFSLSTIIIHFFFFSFRFKQRARMKKKFIKKSCVIWIAKE